MTTPINSDMWCICQHIIFIFFLYQKVFVLTYLAEGVEISCIKGSPWLSTPVAELLQTEKCAFSTAHADNKKLKLTVS